MYGLREPLNWWCMSEKIKIRGECEIHDLRPLESERLDTSYLYRLERLYGVDQLVGLDSQETGSQDEKM
jgi:hypothetical protein